MFSTYHRHSYILEQYVRRIHPGIALEPDPTVRTACDGGESVSGGLGPCSTATALDSHSLRRLGVDHKVIVAMRACTAPPTSVESAPLPHPRGAASQPPQPRPKPVERTELVRLVEDRHVLAERALALFAREGHLCCLGERVVGHLAVAFGALRESRGGQPRREHGPTHDGRARGLLEQRLRREQSPG